MEPAAGLVKLAARRPARECMLGDRPSLPTRYSHRVPCCLPRPTSRRAYTIPGIARQWAWHRATFMRMETHSTPGCSRFPAAFEERGRSVPNAICTRVGTRELSSMFSGWFQKVRVVPCSTVWLCQSGARAPLRRRPFRSPSGRNLGKLGPVPERTAPLTHELGVGMGGNSTPRGDELEYLASSSALASCLATRLQVLQFQST